MKAHLPADEAARLQALRAYNILDTPPEQAYEDITLLASQITGTPIAVVSLVDGERQWFKSRLGIGTTETPREVSFCSHAILEPQALLIVPDASKDIRFADSPLVTGDPRVRFYAGAPLVTPTGHALGTLCVLDRVPRQLTAEQAEALEALARQVMAQFNLRRAISDLKHHAVERERHSRMLERYHEKLEEANRRLQTLSVTDALTGIPNRRALEQKLQAEVRRASRSLRPLSLLFLDVDHFKAYNDTYGHAEGDAMLRQLGAVLADGIRAGDFAARYGGEEFAVVLPDTEASGACILAERIRGAVEAEAWHERRVTVSVGVACLGPGITSADGLIRMADEALYEAKRSGRNRVSMAAEAPTAPIATARSA